MSRGSRPRRGAAGRPASAPAIRRRNGPPSPARGIDQRDQLRQSSTFLPSPARRTLVNTLMGAPLYCRSAQEWPPGAPVRDRTRTGRTGFSRAHPLPEDGDRVGRAAAGWTARPGGPWSSRAGAQLLTPGPPPPAGPGRRVGPDRTSVAEDDHLAALLVGDPRLRSSENRTSARSRPAQVAEAAHLLLVSDLTSSGTIFLPYAMTTSSTRLLVCWVTFSAVAGPPGRSSGIGCELRAADLVFDPHSPAGA